MNVGYSLGINLVKKKDENIRIEYRSMFTSLGFYDAFIEVDRRIFKEIPFEFVIL